MNINVPVTEEHHVMLYALFELQEEFEEFDDFAGHLFQLGLFTFGAVIHSQAAEVLDAKQEEEV